jgi:hypothetical protein
MIYFEKSQPAPECLELEKTKISGDYKCGDVLDRLNQDFCGKCYICEMRNPTAINVEHFVPHQGDTELKFSWENLFLACAHCNNVKLAQYTNLLNCTKQEDNIEMRLRQKCGPFPKEKVVIEALDDDERTLETKQLLEAIYNGTTKLKVIEAANLRDALLRELLAFQELLLYYFGVKTIGDKAHILEQIKGHLHRSSGFTAIKRWAIRDNEGMHAELGYLLIDSGLSSA